jgi:membrane-associated phospholipid phosphatase
VIFPMWVQILASLGDLRMALAGTALVVCVLAYRSEYRLAMAFVAGIVLAMTAIVMMKLAGIALSSAPMGFRIGSPSGHTAVGTAFVGSIAFLIARHRSALARVASFASAGLASLVIGYSRIANDAHTHFEVIEGLAIGSLALIPLGIAIGRRSKGGQRPKLPVLPFAIILAALLAFRIAVPFQDLNTESLVQLAAALLPKYR